MEKEMEKKMEKEMEKKKAKELQAKKLQAKKVQTKKLQAKKSQEELEARARHELDPVMVTASTSDECHTVRPSIRISRIQGQFYSPTVSARTLRKRNKLTRNKFREHPGSGGRLSRPAEGGRGRTTASPKHQPTFTSV